MNSVRQLKSARLLVVDDEAALRSTLAAHLREIGHEVLEVDSATAALNRVKDFDPDIVFTDVQMPGIDGFELCRLIRLGGANQNTPVVFISARTDATAHAEGHRSGGTDFIAKPFLPGEMAVKALTFAWEGRLRQILADKGGMRPEL